MYSRCCLLSLLGRCSGKKPCCSFLLFCGACFRVLVFSAMEKLKLKCKELFSSRGCCLGCCTKSPIIISVDEYPSIVTKDHSAAQSHRSFSSIGIFDHSYHAQIDSPAFINHGLVLWNQTRQQWIGKRHYENQRQVQEARISWNATLLETNKPFSQPIHLGEMVDFLVDIWEQDGLFD